MQKENIKPVSESIMNVTNSDNNIFFHKSIKCYTDNDIKASDCIKNHLDEIYNQNTTYIDIYNKFKISFSFKTNDKAIDIPNKEMPGSVKILDTIILENINKTEYIVFFYIIYPNLITKYKAVYTSYVDDIKENIVFYKEDKNKYDLILNLSGDFKYKTIDSLIQKIRNFAKFISI